MQQVYERIAGVLLQHRDSDFGRRGGCLAMPQTIDDGKDHSIFNGARPVPVARYRCDHFTTLATLTPNSAARCPARATARHRTHNTIP